MPSVNNISSTYRLASGHEIPAFQLGVYKSSSDVAKNTVTSALKGGNDMHAGYIGVDTAQYYANEVQVGEAIREAGKQAGDVFVTTKVMESAGDVDANYKRCLESIEKIGLGYVDLFLIHSPRQANGATDRKSLWQALERLAKEGRAKSIGVSNYGVKHIEELKKYASVPVSVNQIELHPFHQQRAIVEYCQKNDIILEAYCPIIRGQKKDDPTIVKISEETNKNWAQVLIRWSIQRGFVTLPKSDNPERQKSNADIFNFELSSDQMARLDGLEAGHHVAPCPVDCD
ncbi:Aldo/keto reductase [Wallemia mellicola]|nr:Aldo/keto reductase [Wallemia mellicola]